MTLFSSDITIKDVRNLFTNISYKMHKSVVRKKISAALENKEKYKLARTTRRIMQTKDCIFS